jgi:hypothetical protein
MNKRIDKSYVLHYITTLRIIGETTKKMNLIAS